MGASKDVIQMPVNASPLLKWAGGKRKLIKVIADPVLDQLSNTGGRYIEPFFGGGAVGLYLGLPNMVINDSIIELVDFYQTVRDEPAKVAWALSSLAILGVDEENYYRVRAIDPGAVAPEMRAARMLYLNRLGFNGLYRVNKSGKFNVPYGKQNYRESVVKRKSRDAITSLFPHKGKIEAVSRALATTTICLGDFENVIACAVKGDVVYCDPPYDGTFNSYTEDGFGDRDQVRLAVSVYQAARRGATVMISNSDTARIRELYSWAEIMTTSESRTINADGGGRKPVPCVLIVAEGRE